MVQFLLVELKAMFIDARVFLKTCVLIFPSFVCKKNPVILLSMVLSNLITPLIKTARGRVSRTL